MARDRPAHAPLAFLASFAGGCGLGNLERAHVHHLNVAVRARRRAGRPLDALVGVLRCERALRLDDRIAPGLGERVGAGHVGARRRPGPGVARLSAQRAAAPRERSHRAARRRGVDRPSRNAQRQPREHRAGRKSTSRSRFKFKLLISPRARRLVACRTPVYALTEAVAVRIETAANAMTSASSASPATVGTPSMAAASPPRPGAPVTPAAEAYVPGLTSPGLFSPLPRVRRILSAVL